MVVSQWYYDCAATMLRTLPHLMGVLVADRSGWENGEEVPRRARPSLYLSISSRQVVRTKIECLIFVFLAPFATMERLDVRRWM